MKNEFLITFNKPYVFEGKEYKEVDLSGLENLTTGNLAEADKAFAGSGQVAAVNEMSIGYACIIASKVTDKPVEFFEGLPAKDGIKLKTIVSSFFFN